MEVALVLKDVASPELSKFEKAAKKSTEGVKALDAALSKAAETTKKSGETAQRVAQKKRNAALQEIRDAADRIRLLNAEIQGGKVAMQLEQSRIRIRRQGQTVTAAQLQRVNQLLQKERELKKTLDQQTAARKKQAAATSATSATSKMSMGGTLLAGSGRLLGGLAAGLTGAYVLRDMTRTIADFEQSMAVVKGVTGATGSEFDALRDKARALGATTVFTAQQSADAMVSLSRAGFDASETLSSVTDSLNLAAAGNIELAEAADYVSQTIRQFNLSATEAQRVTDVFVATANKSNTDVRQLAQAMTYSATSANNLGISLEQTAAMLGVLSDRGLKADRAGTGLRMVLAGLSLDSDKAKASIEKMGLTAADLDISALGLSKVLDNLDRGFKGLKSPMEQQTVAMGMFSMRAKDAALILSGLGDELDKKIDIFKDSKGVAEELATAMQNTLGGSFKALRSAIEDLYLATGDQGFGGSLKSLVDTLTGTVRVLAGTKAEADKVSEASRNIAKALDAATYAAGAFIAVRMAAYVVSVGNTLWTMTAALRGATVAQVGLNAAMRINPILAVASAIAAVAAAFRWFGSDVAEATAEVKKHDESLQDLAGSARVMESAYAKLARARVTDNLQRETQALDAIKSNLEKQLDELPLLFEKKAKAGKKFTIGDLIQIDPKLAETDIVKHAQTRNLFKLREGGQDWADRWKRETVSLADAQAALNQSLQRTNTSLTESTKKHRDQVAAQEASRLAAKLAEEQQESLRRMQEAAKTSVDKYIANLKDEIEVLKVLNSEGEIAAQLKELELKYSQAQLTVTDQQKKDWRELLELRKKLNEAGKDEPPRVEPQQRVVGNDGASWAQPQGFGEGFASFAGWDAASKQWESTSQQMAQVGNQTAGAMFNAFQVQFFDPATQRFRDLGDIARDFAQGFLLDIAEIGRRWAAIMAIKGLSNALGLVGAPSVIGQGFSHGYTNPQAAKGMAFDSGGEIHRFATGGIVDTPTTFRFARGAGLMGEAGPEAIMPLRRGPGGRLGVEASGGGGGGGSTQNVTVNYAPTIHAQDAAGVKNVLRDDREQLVKAVVSAMSDGRVRRAVKGAAR